MPNPLYNDMNNQNIIQQFEQFRRSITENPQQKVMQLMQSGKLTQAQLNQMQNSPIAKLLYAFMNH